MMNLGLTIFMIVSSLYDWRSFASSIEVDKGDLRYVPSNEHAVFTYLGRHKYDEKDQSMQFDFVATGFHVACTGPGTYVFKMDAGCKDKVRFGVFSANGTLLGDEFEGRSKGRPENYTVNISSHHDEGIVLRKITEPFGSCAAVRFYGAFVPSSALPAASYRSMPRVDFYGDSDTASFGVDGKADEVVRCLASMSQYENFAHGWVKAAADSVPFDFSVQAVSGIGVVKNAVDFGTPTLSTKTMPEIHRRNLQTVDLDDFESIEGPPDLIVVYIGSNDYTNVFPPSHETFGDTYGRMIGSIREQYADAVVPVLHICRADHPQCGPIRSFANASDVDFYTDTFDGDEPTAGCIGHRGAEQQKILAGRMAAVIKGLL